MFGNTHNLLDVIHGKARSPSKGANNQFLNHVLSSQSCFVERLELKRTLDGHRGCVNSAMFSNAGDVLYTGSDDQCVHIYNPNNGRLLKQLTTPHTGNIFWVKDKLLSGGDTLLTAAGDGRVLLMDGINSKEDPSCRVIHRHRGRAHRLDLINNEPDLFYSCGEDGIANLFDLRLETPLVSKCEMGSSIYCISSDPVRSHIFAISGLQTVAEIYDNRNMSSPVSTIGVPHLLTHPSSPSITGLKYNHDGTKLLLSYNDEHAYLVASPSSSSQNESFTSTSEKEREEDTEGNEDKGYITQFIGHRNNDTVKQINFLGRQCEFVVSGSDCGHIFIWRSDSGELVRVMFADKIGATNCLSTHPSLPYLATSGLESNVKLWTPTGPRRHALKHKNGCKPEIHLGGQSESVSPSANPLTVETILNRNDRRRSRSDTRDGRNERMLLRLIMEGQARAQRASQTRGTGEANENADDDQGDNVDEISAEDWERYGMLMRFLVMQRMSEDSDHSSDGNMDGEWRNDDDSDSEEERDHMTIAALNEGEPDQEAHRFSRFHCNTGTHWEEVSVGSKSSSDSVSHESGSKNRDSDGDSTDTDDRELRAAEEKENGSMN